MNKQPKAEGPPRPVCHSCRQPVNSVVARRKNMGVYVPHWTPGPCHNPDCDEYTPEQITVDSIRSTTWKHLTGWTHR